MDLCNKDSLYYIFSQVIALNYRRTYTLLDKRGIYHGQPPMLFTLYMKDGQSHKKLANKLCVKPATITVMIRRMEKSGLLQRRQDEKDQRVSRVYITKQGKKICKEVYEIMKNIKSECFSNFTDEEQMLLRR